MSKTRTLTPAVAWRIDVLGIPAGCILAVTFNNKAAGEMQNRIRAMLAGQAVPSWVGTFHGLGARQLRAEPEVAGLRHGFETLDADDSRRLVKRTMNAMYARGDEETGDRPEQTRVDGWLHRQRDNGARPRPRLLRPVDDLDPAGLPRLF